MITKLILKWIKARYLRQKFENIILIKLIINGKIIQTSSFSYWSDRCFWKAYKIINEEKLWETFFLIREVVSSLMKSERWSNVSVIVRRSLPEWDKYNSGCFLVRNFLILPFLKKNLKLFWLMIYKNWLN